jgi:hypothetical protein
MTPGTIKTKIFILRLIDWLLLLGVMGGGIYAILNSENRPLMAVLALAGLIIVNQFGHWSLTKIAAHRHTLKQLQRTQQH